MTGSFKLEHLAGVILLEITLERFFNLVGSQCILVTENSAL